MAEIARKTFDDGVDMILVDSDPRINGVSGNLGSKAFGYIGGVSRDFVKVGPNSTDWEEKLSTPLYMQVKPNSAGYDAIGSSTVYKQHALTYRAGDLFGTLANNALTLDVGKYMIEIPFQFLGSNSYCYGAVFNNTTNTIIYGTIISPLNSNDVRTGIFKYLLTLTSTTTIDFRSKVNTVGNFEAMMEGSIIKLA